MGLPAACAALLKIPGNGNSLFSAVSVKCEFVILKLFCMTSKFKMKEKSGLDLTKGPWKCPQTSSEGACKLWLENQVP